MLSQGARVCVCSPEITQRGRERQSVASSSSRCTANGELQVRLGRGGQGGGLLGRRRRRRRENLLTNIEERERERNEVRGRRNQ